MLSKYQFLYEVFFLSFGYLNLTIWKNINISLFFQVLSMSGELRRALYANSVPSLDLEPFLPDLVGNTEILTEEHRKSLCRHLPARAEGIFSHSNLN